MFEMAPFLGVAAEGIHQSILAGTAWDCFRKVMIGTQTKSNNKLLNGQWQEDPSIVAWQLTLKSISFVPAAI